jgi:hypothetical protein
MLPGKKKTREKIDEFSVASAFDTLFGWSPHGCTATIKEATAFLKAFSDDQLVALYALASEHYEGTAETRFASELESHGVGHDGELWPFEDEDAVSAIEDMHDALKVRWLVSTIHGARLEKAKKATAAKKLRVVK